MVCLCLWQMTSGISGCSLFTKGIFIMYSYVLCTGVSFMVWMSTLCIVLVFYTACTVSIFCLFLCKTVSLASENLFSSLLFSNEVCFYSILWWTIPLPPEKTKKKTLFTCLLLKLLTAWLSFESRQREKVSAEQVSHRAGGNHLLKPQIWDCSRSESKSSLCWFIEKVSKILVGLNAVLLTWRLHFQLTASAFATSAWRPKEIFWFTGTQQGQSAPAKACRELIDGWAYE